MCCYLTLPHPCPQLLNYFFVYYYFLSVLFDAVVVSWDFFLTDVALVMGFTFVLFCVADCCAERILCIFLIFFKVTAVIISNHRSVTQNKKNDSTVYFSLIFIYWSFLFFYSISFLRRANRTQGRVVGSHWHFIIL